MKTVPKPNTQVLRAAFGIAQGGVGLQEQVDSHSVAGNDCRASRALLGLDILTTKIRGTLSDCASSRGINPGVSVAVTGTTGTPDASVARVSSVTGTRATVGKSAGRADTDNVAPVGRRGLGGPDVGAPVVQATVPLDDVLPCGRLVHPDGDAVVFLLDLIRDFASQRETELQAGLRSVAV